MELLELTKAFTEITGADKTEDLPKRVMDALFSSEKDSFLERVAELHNGDFTVDLMQPIFQYYFADREKGGQGQDFTPKSLAKLCAKLSETHNYATVLDICAGTGTLTIQKWALNPNKSFICEELDDRVIPFLLLNMAIRNMHGFVIRRNILTGEVLGAYSLIDREKYSDISAVHKNVEYTANEIVSNPPYNMKWEPDKSAVKYEVTPPEGNANFAFVFYALKRLNSRGKCTFILPCGITTSKTEKNCRKYLIDNGFLESAMIMPHNMFESTGVGTCVLTLRNDCDNVKLINLTEQGVQETRDQRGQFGGKAHTNRVYHKTVNVLSDELIDKICAYDLGDLCVTADKTQFEEQGYRLNGEVYKEIDYESAFGDTPHRPYTDIFADINRVARERDSIKITVNETLAKKLGLDDLYEQQNVSAELAESLKEQFELLGGTYEFKRFLSLTKNKNEFKMENQNKDMVSSIFIMAFNNWKQHVYYLNNEENRLLAELRDALLPELMSGKIDVSGLNNQKINQ